MVEHDLDFFDELVQAYAARGSMASGLDDLSLRTKVQGVIAEAMHRPLTFDYLTSFTETESGAKEQVARKVAWTLQHGLKAKAWAVNAKLFNCRSGRSFSPVVEQLKRAGVSVVNNRLDKFKEQARTLRHQGTLDAVLMSIDSRVLYVVKGCAFRSLHGDRSRRVQRALAASGGALWDSSDRLLERPVVDADACRTLVLAWGLLKDTFNHLEVVPLYCIVDDLDAGWHFQAHDLTNACWKDFPGSRAELNAFPLFESSLSFIDKLREDSDFLNQVPEWASHSPLYSIPPDRPARGIMVLDVLQREQSGNNREVVPVEATRIAEEIGKRYDLYYTTDMRRHDLEDMLARRQFVTKHPGNQFSITPLGLARFSLAVALAQREVNPDFPQRAMERVFRHAELVWKTRNL